MKTLLIAMTLFGILSSLQGAEPLAVGAKVPEVEGVDQDGATVRFPEVCNKGLVFVYFYPKADTPGCTAQACSLREAFVALTEKGVRVYGVSADTPADQKKFKEKYNLPFALIADSELKVIRGFGVPTLPLKPLAARQCFLFKDGVLVWRDLKASTREQAADVMKALESFPK